MFTWNFQLISKARLADTFRQLKLNEEQEDILIRIHTAAHLPEEAVELAKFIKRKVPEAQIFGTSTSAIIMDGKLIPNQCVISITQLHGGRVKTAILPTFEEDGITPLQPDELCRNVKNSVVRFDTKLLLAFLTVNYADVYSFVEQCNDYFPHVQMLGGLADGANSNLANLPDNTFLFNEKGWTDHGIILASLNGDNIDSFSSYATGVETIGDEMEVTDSLGTTLLTVEDKDAAIEYRKGIGDELLDRPELTSLFPYVCSDAPEFPVFFHYNKNKLGEIFSENSPIGREFYKRYPDADKDEEREFISGNYHLDVGTKIKRAFIYDRKIISDNRALFRKIESFEKAETIFAYSCIVRSIIYSNCIKWELSAYENSNMSGCITYGEIVYDEGRNRFVNGTFAVTAIGENQTEQDYNPYTFLYTETLADDNEELLNYLTYVEGRLKNNEESVSAESLRRFVRECERKILSDSTVGLPNFAALNLDMKLRGVDRVCVIETSDTTSMRTVFSENLINLTYKNYISKCENFAKSKGYHIYVIKNWRVAIAAESYKVSLSQFRSDMENLQKKLFENNEEYIAIVPNFALLDNCNNENYSNAFNSARVRMWQKNIQFLMTDAMDNQLDEESIRENYHMVNVINYAIANDRVIPHYQGIYDNNHGYIHHYEALMRLEDENGQLYYPNSFLEVARSFGLLYDRISLQMIRKVFERFRNSENNSVSINIGIRDIRNKKITDYIYDFLSVAPHPEHFIFELLENEDIDDYNMMVEFVDKIHELGGKISIDDFGSGFSNLQHIINLQSDIVKIDGSIVKNCCDNRSAENLIALISTWKNLAHIHIMIVAEFVENEAIQNKLLQYNIDYSQGYYFAKPKSDIDA